MPDMETKPKVYYKQRNWLEHNQALLERGGLTIWIDQAVPGDWTQVKGGQGRPGLLSRCYRTICVVDAQFENRI